MVDTYTKIVLTVIAVCLVAQVLKDTPIVTKAFAQVPVHVIVDSVGAFAFQFTTVPVRVQQ